MEVKLIDPWQIFNQAEEAEMDGMKLDQGTWNRRRDWQVGHGPDPR
jgi:hypothetical protein